MADIVGGFSHKNGLLPGRTLKKTSTDSKLFAMRFKNIRSPVTLVKILNLVLWEIRSEIKTGGTNITIFLLEEVNPRGRHRFGPNGIPDFTGKRT